MSDLQNDKAFRNSMPQIWRMNPAGRMDVPKKVQLL